MANMSSFDNSTRTDYAFDQSDTENPHLQALSTPWNLSDEERAFSYTNNVVYYSILLPVGICGNIFTLSAVIMVLKMKKSVPNMLIGVLAFADLTSIFTCHVIAIIGMSNRGWVGAADLCRFQSVMAFTYFKLGFFTKTCISIDRLIALKYPLRYRSIVTTRKVVAIILFTTLFSIGSSALTWIVDPEYIIQLETWNMCTNDFSIFTHYKLTIVIGEGTIFLIGVAIFLAGNIMVVKVMLEVSRKLKKLKEGGGTLHKLKLMPLSIVTTASVGFTNIGKIVEVPEQDDTNNNDRSEGSDTDSINELNTPLSKRGLEKLNNVRNSPLSNNQQLRLNTQAKDKTGGSQDRLSAPATLYRHSALTNGDVSSAKMGKTSTSSTKQKRYSTSSLPVNGVNSGERDRKKSIFKKVVELSSKALAKKKQSRRKKELQFAKLVMVIVTVFVILWIPYMVSIYIYILYSPNAG